MLDIGFTKLLIIGGLALVVIGPERLPRVARTAGTLLGRAQRYVADVKAEVNRSMEFEELKRTKQEFDAKLHEASQAMTASMNDAVGEVNSALYAANQTESAVTSVPAEIYPAYQRPKKNWRIKRAALPYWYKQQHGVRAKAQSGAARVARFRPVGLNRSTRP